MASGGYSRVNAHWRAMLVDGRAVFVKQALTDEAAVWLRKERLVYESVRGSFMPVYFGAYDEARTVFLVIEDLTSAEWPPPWSADRISSVLASLEALHRTVPPDGIEPLADLRRAVVGWQRVGADPAPLLGTGLCSGPWLERALPVLLAAGDAAELGGHEFLHFDVRSDNLCVVDSRAVLVDWNLACRGNGRFDVAFWLPSLKLEGGPDPWEILPGAGALTAAVAGFFASRAALPPPAGAPTVRAFQRAQAEVALEWTATSSSFRHLDSSACKNERRRYDQAVAVDMLRGLLEQAFPLGNVDVVDRTGGGDHFHVTVVSPRFDGLGLVDQHRLVYDALSEPLADGTIHELRITTRSEQT